ncbi:MAG TPA: metalloregulator ArsR/SmtB family transcription factor, partial [Actinopolymorphaceae bacterium]|nr:metalloregulator ArsR/SmtB family transcription factor [Actinopolymorphaceae bacterium]
MATVEMVDEVLAALADPTRRRIVELLGVRPHRPSELAARLGTSAPVMSRHLRILLRAQVVDDERVRDDARARVFSLRAEQVAAVQAWLDQVQAQWNEQLAAFKQHAESHAGRDNDRAKSNRHTEPGSRTKSKR